MSERIELTIWFEWGEFSHTSYPLTEENLYSVMEKFWNAMSDEDVVKITLEVQKR